MFSNYLLRGLARFILRILCVVIISTSAGMTIGLGHVKAETTGPNFVDRYGNVLVAVTTGGPMNPGAYGTGKSTTTIRVYYLKAHSRAWHLQVIDEEDVEVCLSCQNIFTGQISSGTFDGFVATMSHAHDQGSYGNSYYTSVFPHGAQSCYRYWSKGRFC